MEGARPKRTEAVRGSRSSRSGKTDLQGQRLLGGKGKEWNLGQGQKYVFYLGAGCVGVVPGKIPEAVYLRLGSACCFHPPSQKEKKTSRPGSVPLSQGDVGQRKMKPRRQGSAFDDPPLLCPPTPTVPHEAHLGEGTPRAGGEVARDDKGIGIADGAWNSPESLSQGVMPHATLMVSPASLAVCSGCALSLWLGWALAGHGKSLRHSGWKSRHSGVQLVTGACLACPGPWVPALALQNKRNEKPAFSPGSSCPDVGCPSLLPPQAPVPGNPRRDIGPGPLSPPTLPLLPILSCLAGGRSWALRHVQ